MNVDGAVALVTGGAGGLGAATARSLARAGAHVVVADLNVEAGRSLVRELGDSASFVRLDVTDDESVAAAVELAIGLGSLRVAVAAHGGPAAKSRIVNRAGEIYSVDLFRRTVDVFLTGTFSVLSHAARAMSTNEPLESDQRGVVITTASIAGFEAATGQTDYAAAKGGVISMNLAAARDLAPLGIRVMSIAPGTFFTPAFKMSQEDAEAKFGVGVPNPRRMGHVDEYARLVSAIVDNDYLNGDVIRIDGAQRFAAR
jgi:NAD(P)-dependent dehydrogenase (short-subunit alcohol dehydrogenase family)